MRVTVAEAAAILETSQEYVRLAMQEGVLPIGSAAKMSTRWTYHISPKLLAEYSGADVEKELKVLRKERDSHELRSRGKDVGT